jgi:hypothetical protein
VRIIRFSRVERLCCHRVTPPAAARSYHLLARRQGPQARNWPLPGAQKAPGASDSLSKLLIRHPGASVTRARYTLSYGHLPALFADNRYHLSFFRFLSDCYVNSLAKTHTKKNKQHVIVLLIFKIVSEIPKLRSATEIPVSHLPALFADNRYHLSFFRFLSDCYVNSLAKTHTKKISNTSLCCLFSKLFLRYQNYGLRRKYRLATFL